MTKPKTRNENIVIQDIEKEILIYDLKDNKAFCLNETSALIYQLCDGKRTVAEISQALNKQLKQQVSEDLIWLALNDFKRDNLLENNEQFEINFNGLSRRQIIKKIGFASLIMLPLIASVVAPSAANAASGGTGVLFSFCSSPADCGSTAPNCNFVSSEPLGNNKRCCVTMNTGAGTGVGVITSGSSCAECFSIAETNVCCSGKITQDSCTIRSGVASCSGTCT